jgi:hypothetical protein
MDSDFSTTFVEVNDNNQDDVAQDEHAAHTGEDVQHHEKQRQEETEQDIIDGLYADLARTEQLEA